MSTNTMSSLKPREEKKSESKSISLINKISIFSLIIILIISIIIAVSIGSVKIPVDQVYKIIIHQITGIELASSDVLNGPFSDIIWEVRLPRVILGMVAGMGLALIGTVMQSTVQNPLGDPYILGISSGAVLGATFSIMIGAGNVFTGVLKNTDVAFWGFMGAILASVLVFFLAGFRGKITSIKLVLAGLVVNSIFSALSNLIIYISNDNSALRMVSFWTMGSLTAGKWENLAFVSIVVVISIIYFFSQYRNLDIMLMGEEAAISMGVDINKKRKVYMLISSFVTATLVSVCGIIGFVGLIIPHISRSIVGSNHKKLLPVATLIGAIFLIWTDVIARSVLDNMEMPIGIITSLVGAPYFMYLMIKNTYGFGGN